MIDTCSSCSYSAMLYASRLGSILGPPREGMQRSCHVLRTHCGLIPGPPPRAPPFRWDVL